MRPSQGREMALAVSRIHRSTSVEGLTAAFLAAAPALVDADAFGLYLLDGQLHAKSIYAVRADRCFLTEYERLRMADPCFLHLLRHQSITHTRDLLPARDWNVHPLHQLMSRWGLHYSIQAPLVMADHLVGTVNIARRDRGYFDDASLGQARFLCEEIACAFERIAQLRRLARFQAHGDLPAGAPERTQAARMSIGPDGTTDADRDRDPEPAWVRVAVDHLRRHCALLPSLDDIAEAAGVGRRTLVRGFRRHRGTSPTHMLRDLRFQGVHDALLAARPGTATVADIATQWGFCEFGRFAQEYRRRFDEKPSMTLQRTAASTPVVPLPQIHMLPDESAEGSRRWSVAVHRSH